MRTALVVKLTGEEFESIELYNAGTNNVNEGDRVHKQYTIVRTCCENGKRGRQAGVGRVDLERLYVSGGRKRQSVQPSCRLI